ncbi:MAG: class I SAM-dependent methyltransferase [Nanoarchaeota archaeon]|nr:class I SAM-dependent methyltransferase [Nanoarchaeota archaeon]MBU1028274.1 class I SAM-dependent methyltransferase [Nanoarchaeota archaeon]
MKTRVDFEKKLFNSELKEWEETIKTPRYKYLVKKVKEILKKKKYGKVLEVGCGITPYLGKINAKKKIGLDISKELLKRNNKDYGEFINGNALNCSKILKEKFDFIFMVGFLHHINEKEHFKLIKEIKKLLKKEGELLIVEPNMVSITFIYYYFKKLLERINQSFVKKIIGFLDEDEKYIYPKKIKKILLKNNFQIKKAYTIQTLRFPPLKLIKKINIEKINQILDKLIKRGGSVIVIIAKKNKI